MIPVFLLSDFGLSDPYAGQMRAMLMARAPGCTPTDLTHGIPAQDVRAGARALGESLPFLPQPAVVLAVVDPGVGTARRPLAVRAGGLAAVGPDNGLLTPLLTLEGARAVELDPIAVHAAPLSSTFHGRDLFAPAAASLAKGKGLESIGVLIDDPVLLSAARGPERIGGGWLATITSVDHFGNLITNLGVDLIGEALVVATLPDGSHPEHVETYGEAAPGGLVALVGSGGWLEVAVNGGSASTSTGLSVGATIRVELR
jgi:S-adenosyl-L-methionine hydrolase (adenosine-forming)